MVDRVREVLALRNCVMHYKPVLRRDLMAKHDAIYRLFDHMSPDLAAVMRQIDHIVEKINGRCAETEAENGQNHRNKSASA